MDNPDALTRTPPANKTTQAEGVKDSLPIAISSVSVAFAVGLNTIKLCFTPQKNLFFSCIIYVRASPFAIVAMLTAGNALTYAVIWKIGTEI